MNTAMSRFVTVSGAKVGTVTPCEGEIADEERARWRTTTGRDLPAAGVRRLLQVYRPDLIGRDDITTPHERREAAFLLALFERTRELRKAA